MDVMITLHCNNCNRDAKMKVRLGTTTKELEEEIPCIHCQVKGKLKRLGY